MMIRTLDRYVLKAFLFNYFMSLFVLISLYVVLDLFVNFDEFTENKKPIAQTAADIFDYYIYNVPLYFSQLSGVITAFAACLTMARMQRQNEITAMLASGTSLYRVALPIMLASLGVNGLLVLDQEMLLPRIAPKLARERDDVEGNRAYGIWCVRDGENRLFSAQYFSPRQQKIRGLIVMELNNQDRPGALGDVITATIAKWAPERHGWILEHRGVRIRVVGATTDLRGESSLTWEPLDFYPCELNPAELLVRQTAQWMRFLNVRQLNELQKRDDVDRAQIAQIKHGRFTLPVNNMILLLLGLVFFMNRLPENVLTQGAKALGSCAAAFMVVFIGQQLVGTAGFNPALPAWLPIFIFGPVVVLLLDNVKT